GFEALMCSDHFKPWTTRQQHSGAAWSWLPAALQATTASFGTVNAPGQRYHPALIAQAAATIADLFPGRFWFAVGTGEALNESITGDEWPPKAIRRARLEESVSMMRALWAGPRGTMRAIVEAFRERAGSARPIYLQVPLSFAPTEAQARAAAHEQWRHVVLSPEQLADLRSPEEFDAATAAVTADDVAAKMRVSADLQRHVAWLQEEAELGYERIYLHNVATARQEWFIEQMASALLPAR
ncbi:MAG: LLM class flavin-dependent oxidoreductase, partial [Vicinamibacterales bacterium]